MSQQADESKKAIKNSSAPLVWINGFPGVGKLTIARKLQELFGPKSATLISNHELIDPVAARLARDHPDYHVERKAERQKAFKGYVQNVTAFGKVIICTDCQSDNQLGLDVAGEYQDAASKSGRAFVPVLLTCDESENLSRVCNVQREDSGTTKLTDPHLVSELRAKHTMLAFDVPEQLRLDVTTMSVEEAAAEIFAHVTRFQ
ncbi:hypothetical protein HII31_03391 [Pseudocercospora fuligena]|uniref:Uncharacterized protein n=1 Tax=Pseudocercospora fuligena TaxID=685502 RepID=A0A8H6VQH3_9PEZI|nr:hypothetical protein HII31_03391 [Pseudocercospora fuligena]